MLCIGKCSKPVAAHQPVLSAPVKLCARAPWGRLRVRGHMPICLTGGSATSETFATNLTDTPEASAVAAGLSTIERAANQPLNPGDEAQQIVDQVLEAIKGTDSGLQISPETRALVDALLDRLETIGAAQQPRPLESPLLWGNYNVAYTSVGRSQERGEPAGGRFRGHIGRALFRTAGLFQSVLQPDIATNKVEFRLLGFLPGFVGLRGRVLPQGDSGDTVQVLFEPPILSIANSLHLRIGRISSVVLTTTYLDERVRLGKGSRGSLFVFTRGGAADAAGMAQVGLQRTSFTAAAAFTAFFLSLFLGGAALWVSGQVALKAAALALWLLGAAMGGVVRQGGLVMDRDDESIAAAMKAELERRQKQQQQQGVVSIPGMEPSNGSASDGGSSFGVPAAA